MRVQVHLGDRSYDIDIVREGTEGLGRFARPLSQGKLAFVVTDQNVQSHAGKVTAALEAVGFHCETQVLPAGESQKSLASASILYDRLADLHADRKTLVVAVGGGVIGDLTGFVAATYNRGLKLLMVPTTLLAMVDSSVGGKVGVNHPRGKNLIGAFHQPAGVWISIPGLHSLPEREYVSGLAEVVKYGVILDAGFFSFLEDNRQAILKREHEVVEDIVAVACRLKAGVVEQDEREETGLRAILNYGHTFAHAFETVAGYGTWLHGEAVAAGMVCASKLAERKGRITADVTARQRRLLRDFGLPTRPLDWPSDDLLAVMRRDKKSISGQLRFILPRHLGAVEMVEDIDEKDVRQVLADMADEPEA